MPIVACQQYLKGLLDSLPMPGALGDLNAYVTPPDPNEDTTAPQCYIWPTDGDESRNPQEGGTVPRNTGFGTPSGTKVIVHQMDIYLTLFVASDDQDSDVSFPAVIDKVMWRLRTAPSGEYATDPETGLQSQLVNIGEQMKYHTGIVAVEDEAYNRLDCLITMPVWEIFNA